METVVQTASTTKWVLDQAHSELMFKVKHLMISNVKGTFRTFNIELSGEDPIKSPIKVHIDAASIFTNDDQRDGHLKSADFFDVDNHKEILFESTSFRLREGSSYELKGMLTIKGISKEISLMVDFGGIIKDPWGNDKAGFSLTGKIHRKDWELNWNAALETGGVLVSDEVNISADLEFLKQA